MKPVLAVFVGNIQMTERPGTFRFFSTADGTATRVAGIFWRCPKCAELETAGFIRPTRPGRPVWSWDGNRAAPTLTPSFSHACGWQGALERGVWTPA